MDPRTPLPRAKKSLGQHFLIDDNICRKIVAAVGIAPGDRVLEIGPGPGALTRFLDASEAGTLRLVEMDRDLAQAARERWPRAEVREQDALTLDWDALAAEGPWRIVGNLPYNVASRIIWDMAPRMAGLSRAVFMVQLEVAERLRAEPGGRQFGALGAWVQAFCRGRNRWTRRWWKSSRATPGRIQRPPSPWPGSSARPSRTGANSCPGPWGRCGPRLWRRLWNSLEFHIQSGRNGSQATCSGPWRNALSRKMSNDGACWVLTSAEEFCSKGDRTPRVPVCQSF